MFLDVSIALKHPGEPYAFRVEQEIAPQEIGGETITFDPAVLEGTYSTEEEQVTVEGEDSGSRDVRELSRTRAGGGPGALSGNLPEGRRSGG